MHEDLGSRLEVLLDELLRDQDHAQLGPAVQVQLSDVLLLEGQHAVSVSLTRERFLVGGGGATNLELVRRAELVPALVLARTAHRRPVQLGGLQHDADVRVRVLGRRLLEDREKVRDHDHVREAVDREVGAVCSTPCQSKRKPRLRSVSKHALVSVRSQGKLVHADAGVQQEPVEAVEASGEFLRQGRDRLQVLKVAHFRRNLSALLTTLSRGILPLAQNTVEPVGVRLLRRGIEVPGPDVLDRGVGRFLWQIQVSWRYDLEEDLQDCRLAFLEAVMVTSAP